MDKGKSKYIVSIIIIVMTLLISNFSVYGKNHEIHSINVTGVIKSDGSIYIEEVWRTNITSGTEMYITHKNMGDISIENLNVSDETGEFVNVGTWDVDKSIAEKANTFGINKLGKGDYEICWGVGSYEEHIYKITYTLTNMVKSYSDADGLHHEFVTHDLSANPKLVTVILGFSADITENLLKYDEPLSAWAFGFYSNVKVDKAFVAVNSTEPLISKSKAIVTLKIDKGFINPTTQGSGSFEEVIDKAKVGSSYAGKRTIWSKISSILLSLSGFFILFLRFGLSFFTFETGEIIKIDGKGETAKYLKKKNIVRNVSSKTFAKNVNYHRDIPFDQNIFSAAWALNTLGHTAKNENIISAIFLKWIFENRMEIKVDKDGRKTERILIFAKDGGNNLASSEARLFNLLMRASNGSGLLSEKTINRWSKKNYDALIYLYKDFYKEGLEILNSNNMTMKVKRSRYSKYDYILNESGMREAMKLLGLKNYLADFSVIKEREPIEVNIWEYYLIFASIFGIAEQVQEDFKKMYPDMVMRNTNNRNINIYHLNHMSRTYSRGVSRGYTSSISGSSGGGGFGSFGGGGGSSGGGGGGGSR